MGDASEPQKKRRKFSSPFSRTTPSLLETVYSGEKAVEQDSYKALQHSHGGRVEEQV